MPSAFVPVYTPDRAQRQLQDRVQRATTSPAQSPALRTKSFNAAAGAVYRVRSTSTSTLDVLLPASTAADFGRSVTLLVDQPVGSVRVTCPTGTINAVASVTIESTGLHIYVSDGAGGWLQAVGRAGFGLSWDATNLELDVDQTEAFAWTGSHAFSNTIRLDGIISPSITANQNDWNPTGFSTCNVVRCEVDATPRTVTGMVPPSDNGHLRFFFNSGSNSLTFTHQDAASVAANRVICPSAASLVLGTNDGVIGWYDSASNRWRLVGL